jgi:hypothetical protein
LVLLLSALLPLLQPLSLYLTPFGLQLAMRRGLDGVVDVILWAI